MRAAPEHSTSEAIPRAGQRPPEPMRPAGPDPPGLAAIRRFFRRRWIQGVWAWLCYLGRGIQAAWQWLGENAGPIARGVEKAGDIAVRTSQGAVAVGRSAREIGGKVQTWGRERGSAGLRRIGKGMGRFGDRLARGGKQAEDVGESVEELGEALTEIVCGDDEPKRPAERKRSAGRKRSAARRPAIKAPSRPRRPGRRLPPPAERPETPAPAGSPPPESDSKLPEAIQERIRALGRRKRSGPLRELIVDICTLREWTSVGELAGWFGMNTSNLQQRHLRPMLESGALRLRHPDNPRHPEQGYRAVER